MKFKAAISRRLGLLLSTILLIVASFALSASPAAADTYTVKMGSDTGQLKFVPDTLTVKPGDTIQFQMNKLAPHNAVFDATAIPNKSATLAKQLSNEKLLFSPGESYKVTIPGDAPEGTYSYFCQPHRGAGMVGKIIVKG
jgi:plastocyanin